MKMTELAREIEELDDDQAVSMLKSIANAQAPLVDIPEPSPELAASLREAFPASGKPDPGDGDLARTALLWLAQDPDFAPLIEARIDAPDAQRFAVGEIALSAAVLTVLASSIEFEVTSDKNGRKSWTFRYTKPSLKVETGRLMEKLAAWLER